MPWNERKPIDERLRFIARLLEGEKMVPLCREFGISWGAPKIRDKLIREYPMIPPPAAADCLSGIRLAQSKDGNDDDIINRPGRSTDLEEKSVLTSGATPV
jgi:hypothetical protein